MKKKRVAKREEQGCAISIVVLRAAHNREDNKQNTQQKTNNTLKKNIIGFKRNEKKELREIEKKLKNKLERHTKMDPSKYDDSIFNEIASIINEKPKQCTKIHNFIHKFLEKQITN